jgi:hypothetical protein
MRPARDGTRQDIHAFGPRGTGTSPVVVALHGIDGSGQDMAEFATRLARAGMVVFAPTYRSDLTTPDGLSQTGHDIACGYWFARTDASQHGGDLSEPVTALGWSLDADFAVLGGLSVAGPSPDDPCPGDTPAPDVVVGISCCYSRSSSRPRRPRRHRYPPGRLLRAVVQPLLRDL